MPVKRYEAAARVSLLVLILASLVSFVVWVPLGTAVQIGADEGFELAKAELCASGFRLYEQVWNDQPPLHTFLTSGVVQQMGEQVLWLRLLTCFFALGLATAFFFLVLSQGGVTVALLAVWLLICSPGFLEPGASCMLEIPTLFWAVAGLSFLAVAARRPFWRQACLAAGGVFGLAMLTKLIAAVLLPVASLILWLGFVARKHERHAFSANLAEKSANVGFSKKTLSVADRFFRAGSLAFLFGLVLAFVVGDFMIDGGAFLRNFQQTWTSHFGAAKSFEYGSAEDHPFDLRALGRNWDATLPALAGVFICARQLRKKPLSTIPIVWLALILAIFGFHRPWWGYYYVHLALPLCWCASIGLDGLGRHMIIGRRIMPKLACCGLFSLLAVWTGARFYLEIRGIRQSPQTFSALALEQARKFKGLTRFMYTDAPVCSFHCGIAMPPDLAVLPLKRFWAAEMTNERLSAEMRSIKPGILLLANDPSPPPFQNLISSDYRLVYEDAHHRLFALRPLAKSAGF